MCRAVGEHDVPRSGRARCGEITRCEAEMSRKGRIGSEASAFRIEGSAHFSPCGRNARFQSRARIRREEMQDRALKPSARQGLGRRSQIGKDMQGDVFFNHLVGELGVLHNRRGAFGN
eukprot:409097-Pleurochrysis_carterae.AAC.5